MYSITCWKIGASGDLFWNPEIAGFHSEKWEDVDFRNGPKRSFSGYFGLGKGIARIDSRMAEESSACCGVNLAAGEYFGTAFD
jgi:hypothetical protein